MARVCAPVFDYLQPDGYFKTHKAEISDINHNIAQLQGRRLSPSAAELPAENPIPAINKSRLANETDEEYIHRRLFENAELHRWKLRERDTAKKKQQDVITSLKTLRSKNSDDLQCWLFRHFQMRNGKGETQDLLLITVWYRTSPSFSKRAGGETFPTHQSRPQ